MSEVSVNIISPRTATNIEIEGLNPPTYLGQPLALSDEVVNLTGGTMTGPLVLSGNAVAPLGAVPLQQAIVKSGNVGDAMTGPLILSNGAYAASPATEPQRAVTYDFLNTFLNSKVSKGTSDFNYTVGNGYQVFPGGLIVNWMQVSITDIPVEGVTATLNFPKAFPNACLFCIGGVRLTGGQTQASVQVATTTWTTTQVGYYIQEWAAVVNPINAIFLAIGH